MTNAIQVSGKVGDAIVVIGGATPEEFLQNCSVILGEDNEIQNLFAMGLDTASLTTVQAQRNVIDGGLGNPVAAPAPAPVQQPAAQPGAPTATDTGPKTETDKWGATYVYGIPGAPGCPHGARVQKKATSKAGKPYTMWVCPTWTPSAYRQGVSKDAACEGEFSR